MRRRVILLFIVGFAFVFLNGESFSRASSSEKVPDQRSPQKSEEKTFENGPPTRTKESSEKPYTSLVEKNIFSPERKEFPLMISPAGPVKKPPARPQVVLYGVTLAGDYQSASIAQSGRTLKKGERDIFTLKVGEKIGEYELKNILPDRITLESEGDSFEVLLYDAAKPKPRTAVRTESRPATVTSALPGPPPVEPSRPAVPGGPTSEIPRPTAPTPVPGPERVATPPMPTPGAPATIVAPPTPSPQPAAPSIPPVYSPRRRVPVPALPGTVSPETTPPQAGPRESGGP
jgi:hypothetical protein